MGLFDSMKKQDDGAKYKIEFKMTNGDVYYRSRSVKSNPHDGKEFKSEFEAKEWCNIMIDRYNYFQSDCGSRIMHDHIVSFNIIKFNKS